ncbi:unnamed protein product [Cuscuta epithymum]|uniref:BHLH domain-containing protein n=1 Tax=Cuscuta epithymum TaxID=186058 RepID=A0AAV0CT67_9ASTE|nr:unnamed protein product [Cuscuta epithymum]
MQPQSSIDAYMGTGVGTARSDFLFPEMTPVLPWPVQSFNPISFHSNQPIRDHEQFLLPPPPSPYGGLFNSRRLSPSSPFAGYDGLRPTSDHFRGVISDSLGHPVQPGLGAPFGLQAELQKMTAQEIMDAKALAASKSHSEAERRRRERINNHLAKLRSLLPNTTKTDKASLLAEVIQHVKELRRQTSLISETNQIPTEIDELTVDASDDDDGKPMIRASLCCEDRPDLLSDLIKTLKALRLRTLKAEITTIGGRVRNVLFIAGDDKYHDSGSDPLPLHCCLSSVQEALKAVIEKGNSDDQSGNAKRQRTHNLNIHEQHTSL